MTGESGGLPPGWGGIELDEIDSTNSEALRRAAAGEAGPLWIAARHQTRGRGRAGRSWTSAEGSLAATLLLRPAAPPERLAGLALVAGVAAHEAIAAAVAHEARPGVRLKWPNDVLVAGAKVSGILVESSIAGGRAAVVIGIGINLAAVPELGGRGASSLASHGSRLGFQAMSRGLAAALARWLAAWDDGRGFGAIRVAWLERAGPPGEPISVNAGEGPVSGRFAGLDEDGALLLDDASGQRRRFTFGDVALGASRV